MTTTARLLRLLVFFFSSYILYSIFYIPTFAQQEFSVSYNTVYTLKNDGAAQVTQEITLTNNFSTIYATSYTLILEGKTPENMEAFQGDKVIPVETKEEEGRIKITAVFPDAVVGRGKSRVFSVKYTLPKVAVQNGQVWDVTVPKLASPETISSYKLTLQVPGSFGNPAYISPEPKSKENAQGFQNFAFDKEDLARAGVVATFGQSQIFSVFLTYHLENPYSSFGETEIALPPDTAFQRVYYEKLEPGPAAVRLDEDGNWLARYRLKPKEKLQIELRIRAQIFAKPQEFYQKIDPAQHSYYLAETEFWQADDPEIKGIARTLRTPRAIYDFVTGRLNYDYSRVTENASRLGAKEALNNPDRAICMEFTDLFVALARSAGIPAREINGYAYTENPQIQPLSLVADVLHSWPEFWDEERGIWRPVDPTWGKTTGGVDFFGKFDLSHITFAIHGKDPNSPLAAGSYKESENPQKDVKVEFSQLPAVRAAKPDIEIDFKGSFLPFNPGRLKVKISNPGPTALYNTPLNINPGGFLLVDNQAQNIQFLAPFDAAAWEIPVKLPFLPRSSQESIIVSFGDTATVYNIALDQIRAGQIATVFGSLLFLSAILLLGIKHQYLVLVIQKIWRFRFKKQPNFPK